ncbi:large ribosomal subunit protein mL64-like [Rhinoraja longicauda]
MAAPMVRGLAGAAAYSRCLPAAFSAAAYHARPLGRGRGGGGAGGLGRPGADRKRWAAAGGEASGVAVASLWPGPEELHRLARHQVDWQPPLQQLCDNIRAADSQRQQRQRYRQKLIASNMAKMPKMVEDWRREKREAKVKQREEKARRDRLLVEARERFGYSIDPRNAKFQDMVKELEKEEKKKQKLIKRRQNIEAGRSEVVTAVATP